MELTASAVLMGVLLDCLLGDPAGLPHPVCLMGRCIFQLERLLRGVFAKTPRGELFAGGMMAALMVLLSTAIPAGILLLCARISPWLYWAVSSIMCWQILAAKCLMQEALKVRDKLEDLPAARHQVSMLVGRDTQQLTGEQVIKATVETVAENTCDGVVAPLLYLMLGGPVAGFAYKAINTMDSMVGYRNDRYLYFGRAAAKLDDAANYIPARLAGLGMVAAAFLCGLDGKNAWRIWKRDRRRHDSPNSAQTESACAGALGVQLGGNASYFGKVHAKPCLGEPLRPVEGADIARSCRLMYAASGLLLIIFALAEWWVCRLI